MRSIRLALLISASLCAPVVGQSIRGYAQLSYDVGGTWTPDTEWGVLTYSYTSANGLEYLNLNVEGRWAISNWPLFGHARGEQVRTIEFGLGIPRGTRILGQMQRVRLTVTPAPGGDPGVGAPMLVGGETRRMTNGIGGGTPTLPTAPDTIQCRGTIAHWAAHPADFPNQVCGPLECVPAAISNSLQFLKARNPHAPWGNLALDIGTFRTEAATGWVPGSGTTQYWNRRKQQFMNTMGYPVDTIWTRDPQIAFEYLQRGCDVEATVYESSNPAGAHCAAITGMGKTSEREWAIEFAHDACQDNRADPKCQVRVGSCMSATRRLWGGGAFLHDRLVFEFTIECVTECYLMAGTQSAFVPLLGSPDDILLLVPLQFWPVTLSRIPDLNIPADPRLLGLPLYFQVVMINSAMFPEDPLQLTNGLEAVIGGGEPTAYGRETSMRIWGLGSTQLGGVLRVRFTMPGQ